MVLGVIYEGLKYFYASVPEICPSLSFCNEYLSILPPKSCECDI